LEDVHDIVLKRSTIYKNGIEVKFDKVLYGLTSRFMIFGLDGEQARNATLHNSWNFINSAIYDDFWFDLNHTILLYNSVEYVLGKE